MTTALLATCKRLYATLTPEPPADWPDFTTITLDAVQATLKPADVTAYPATVEAFVNVERDALTVMLRHYGPGRSFTPNAYRLAQTPAVLAVCERLSVCPLWLKQEIEDRFEDGETLTDEMRGVWGW